MLRLGEWPQSAALLRTITSYSYYVELELQPRQQRDARRRQPCAGHEQARGESAQRARA